MARPDKIWLYRMTHVDNLAHILQHGLVVAGHPEADPQYRIIGDHGLIRYRKELTAPDPPGGKFSDYIPFYLGLRSPMLYQIATGHAHIEKIPQSDIIYIVTSHDIISEKGLDWFFSDGHARYIITRFYTIEAGFDDLDWEAISANKWNNTEEDPDRQRKKQAEYLVRNAVPLNCIEYFLTFDLNCKQKVESLQIQYGADIPVKVSEKAYYDHL
jgi:hypothetical protein